MEKLQKEKRASRGAKSLSAPTPAASGTADFPASSSPWPAYTRISAPRGQQQAGCGARAPTGDE